MADLPPTSDRPGLRVLFIATYPEGTAPGQRYRFEQYFAAIRRIGGKAKLSPFYSRSTYGVMHGSGRLVYKVGATLWGLLRRLGDLLRAPSYDIVFIYREASPLNLYALEAALLTVARYSLYDFDDSIWIPDTSEANRGFSFLKSGDKVARIIKRADRTLVANAYLEAYAKKAGGRVHLMPTSIDAEVYDRQIEYRTTPRLTVGWTGSNTTLKYLAALIPLLERVFDRVPFRLRVIGGSEMALETRIPLELIPWSSAREVADLLPMDVGINPMPVEPWTRGKSSLKVMQYMALGIPSICARYDFSEAFIRDGDNGLLANDGTEWEEALVRLLTDAPLRERIGRAGRETIHSDFTNAVLEGRFLMNLRAAHVKSPPPSRPPPGRS
jgi:glycosyltransferase involved in cell wall biosynthesis